MRASTQRRERILSFGGPGAGKTRAWLTIAELYRRTETPQKFYVIDTDDAYWANVEEFPELADSGIVEARFVYEWDDYTATAKEFAQKATSGDWIVCDLFDKGWEEAQNAYSQKVYGEDKADYFVLRREEVAKQKKDPKNFQAFDGWTDWPVVKAMHAGWANDVLFRNQAHVFITASMKPINRKTDDKDVVEALAHLGARPGGEKAIAVHGVNTILKLTNKGAGEWVMDTGKDRGERQDMINVKLNNFAMDYLLHPARGKWVMR